MQWRGFGGSHERLSSTVPLQACTRCSSTHQAWNEPPEKRERSPSGNERRFATWTIASSPTRPWGMEANPPQLPVYSWYAGRPTPNWSHHLHPHLTAGRHEQGRCDELNVEWDTRQGFFRRTEQWKTKQLQNSSELGPSLSKPRFHRECRLLISIRSSTAWPFSPILHLLQLL